MFGAISLLEFVSKRLVSKLLPVPREGEGEVPPISSPLVLLIFFSFSDFAKHSTIYFFMISLSQNLLLHNYLSHNFLYDFLVTEFIIAQLFISQFSLCFPCHRIYYCTIIYLTVFFMLSLSQNLLLHNYLSHNFLYDFLVTEFIIAQLFISQFSLCFPCHRIYYCAIIYLTIFFMISLSQNLSMRGLMVRHRYGMQ